jgi:hypothetical protein
VYAHLVAWEGVEEDTERSYSACLGEISQNASKKKNGPLKSKKYSQIYETEILSISSNADIPQAVWSLRAAIFASRQCSCAGISDG